jgi:hypothetical protein
MSCSGALTDSLEGIPVRIDDEDCVMVWGAKSRPWGAFLATHIHGLRAYLYVVDAAAIC